MKPNSVEQFAETYGFSFCLRNYMMFNLIIMLYQHF